MASNNRFPTLFVSHGAPDIILTAGENRQSLGALSDQVPRPRAVVVVSAHWMDDPVGISAADKPATIHDFGGFQPEMYEQQYPASGDAELSQRISGMFAQQGIATKLHFNRGLDHGAWIPLMLMYPAANIPVVQVSLPSGSLDQIIRVGEALAPLRDAGVLIIGSGGSVHNLRMLNRSDQTEPWVEEFEEWLRDSVENNRFENLVDQHLLPATFRLAHPTTEHYLPLVVAWAAGDRQQPGRRLHQGFSHGNLGMSHYRFGVESDS